MGADKGQNANPPDDGWDDDGWDLYDDGSPDGYWLADDDALWADAALDGRVRQQLATLVPLHHEAFDRWEEIQPRMARARRRRHAAQALASSVLVAAVALAGVQGAGRFLPEDTSVVQTADGGGVDASEAPPPMVGIGAATSTVAADGGATSPGPSADAGGEEGPDEQGVAPGDGSAAGTPTGDETTLATAGSTGSTGGSSSVPANGGSAASSVSITPPASYTPTSPAPATNSTTVRSTTVRSTTSTTRSTTSTTRATTTTTTTVATVITVRELATIDVTLRGNEIRLVAVHNKDGVTSQVHNSGPQKIEITFKKGSEEHDLVATVHNGNVVTSIVDSGDD